MALDWITEPSGYSGVVGSTMDVNAQTSISDTIVYYSGDSGFLVSDYTIEQSGAPTYTAGETLELVTSESQSNYEEISFILDQPITNEDGSTLKTVFSVDSGSTVLVRLLRYDSQNFITVYNEIGDTLNVNVKVSNVTTSHSISTVPIMLADVVTLSYQIVSDSLIVVVVIIERNGIIVEDSTTELTGTLLNNSYRDQYTVWLSAYLATMTYYSLEVSNASVNLSLKDNIGVSRVVQISNDGFFSESILGMQTVDTGTWTLEAESGGEAIVSEFNVDVSDLEWVHEPTNPNSVSIGGALNVGAEVSISSGVDWTLSLNGEVVNEALDSTGLYSFSSVVNPAYDSSGWLLTASCCGDIISSAFSVAVSASNSIKDTYKSGEVFDFEGTPLNGVTRLVSSFTITGQGENIIQDVYASSDDIQDVYSV